MTPEERLRQWAEKIKEYGPDLTRWAGPSFIVAECLRMADEFRKLTNNDPQCESQDVDLDHHEADSPEWTCDTQVRAVSREETTYVVQVKRKDKDEPWCDDTVRGKYGARCDCDADNDRNKYRTPEAARAYITHYDQTHPGSLDKKRAIKRTVTITEEEL